MDLPEEAKRAPPAPVWNQSFLLHHRANLTIWSDSHCPWWWFGSVEHVGLDQRSWLRWPRLVHEWITALPMSCRTSHPDLLSAVCHPSVGRHNEYQ